MIYILIVMWLGTGQSDTSKTALAVEFNTLKACQATAAEIRKQKTNQSQIGTLVCAQKGYPQ